MTPDPFLSQLLTLPNVHHAYLSPDGRWVAFDWYGVHANLDVFVVPTDGSAKPQALTHTPEETSFVSWTSDSRAVVVQEDHGGDERRRLFRVDLARPLEMQPLTEDRPPYFIRSGDLSPGGDFLYYGANYDFATNQPVAATWIYRHDLVTGLRTLIARPEKPAFTTPKLNATGSHLVYARKDRHPSGRQFYLVDADGRADREILNFGDEVKVYARWFPDGENLLVISEATGKGPQEHVSLGLYCVPTGELRWLVDDPQRNIESAWISPDGLVVVDELEKASHKPSVLDSATGVEIRFPDLPGNLFPLGRTPDGAWVATYEVSTAPAELVRFHLKELQAGGMDAMQSLTRVWERTELDRNRLTRTEPFAWQSVDGLEVRGWLYRARPNSGKAIIYVHGGPSFHSEDYLNPPIQYYAAQGFNVLDVNYRGSTGYGLKFRELIKEDGWGGREQADIAAGAEALIRAGLAQPGKVGVTGTSYGGYSSWFLITHTLPEVIAAAAPICGMTDLVVDYETTRPDLRPYTEEMMGGRPDQIPGIFYERSPVNFVQNIHGKLLIIQGAQDPNVTPENVRQVRQKLDEHAIPYETLIFEDEGHGIHKPANQAVLYARIAEFFDQAFGDR